MTLIAGVSAVGRVERRYRGIWLDSIVSVWASSWLVAAWPCAASCSRRPLVQAAIRHPAVGHDPGQHAQRHLAWAWTGWARSWTRNRDQVETLLALGATRWEAARPCDPKRRAHRHDSHDQHHDGRRPGQPAGHDDRPDDRRRRSPMQAVKYQIVIMFLIAAGTSLGTVGVVLLGYRRLFSRHHQFLARKLTAPDAAGPRLSPDYSRPGAARRNVRDTSPKR